MAAATRVRDVGEAAAGAGAGPDDGATIPLGVGRDRRPGGDARAAGDDRRAGAADALTILCVRPDGRAGIHGEGVLDVEACSPTELEQGAAVQRDRAEQHVLVERELV